LAGPAEWERHHLQRVAADLNMASPGLIITQPYQDLKWLSFFSPSPEKKQQKTQKKKTATIP